MAVIFKFPNRKVRQYSDKFLKRINPNKIGDFIQAENPGMSIRAADAMALAVIYSTYLQLVFEEEGEKQFWKDLDIDAEDIACTLYQRHLDQKKSLAFFVDDTILWHKIYNNLVPKLKKNIDFLVQPKV